MTHAPVTAPVHRRASPAGIRIASKTRSLFPTASYPAHYSPSLALSVNMASAEVQEAKLDIQPESGHRETVKDPNLSDYPQGYRPVEIDAVTEKRLVRKTDRVVVTLVFCAYLFAFLDRSNIGNAQTAGMGKDLGFDDPHYQVRHCSASFPLLSLFFFFFLLYLVQSPERDEACSLTMMAFPCSGS